MDNIKENVELLKEQIEVKKQEADIIAQETQKLLDKVRPSPRKQLSLQQLLLKPHSAPV